MVVALHRDVIVESSSSEPHQPKNKGKPRFLSEEMREEEEGEIKSSNLEESSTVPVEGLQAHDLLIKGFWSSEEEGNHGKRVKRGTGRLTGGELYLGDYCWLGFELPCV